jgi:hypothetical protein
VEGDGDHEIDHPPQAPHVGEEGGEGEVGSEVSHHSRVGVPEVEAEIEEGEGGPKEDQRSLLPPHPPSHPQSHCEAAGEHGQVLTLKSGDEGEAG